MAVQNADQRTQYFILSVSRKLISLTRVAESQTSDIKDANFPMIYIDDHEYARSVIGTSFGYSSKGFEKDKSAMKKTRFIAFLRTADKHLSDYIGTHSIILAGVQRDLADFREVTRHSRNIIGEVKGNYSGYNRQKLLNASQAIHTAGKAWAVYKAGHN